MAMFFIQRPVSFYPQHPQRPDYYQQSPEERYYRQIAEEHNRRAELALRLAQQERQRALRERELQALRARQYQEQLARRSQYEQEHWNHRRPPVLAVRESAPAFDLVLPFANPPSRGYPIEPVQRQRSPEVQRSFNRRPTSFFEHLLQSLELPSEPQTEGSDKRVRFGTEQVAPQPQPQPAKKDKGKARAPVQEEPANARRQDAPKPVDTAPSFWDFFGGLRVLEEEDAIVRQLNLFGDRSYPGLAQQGVAGSSGTRHPKPSTSPTTFTTPLSVPPTKSVPTAPVNTAVPTPSATSSASSSPKSHAASFTSLDAIQSRFDALKSSFVFPDSPQFESATSTSSGVPRLSNSSPNASVHEYENELTKLLTKLDAVESDGAESIRGARKALVVAIEQELDKLDEEKKTAWRNSIVEEESPADVSESGPVTEALTTPLVNPSEEESAAPISTATTEEVRGYDVFEPSESVSVTTSSNSEEPKPAEVSEMESTQEKTVQLETADPSAEEAVETSESVVESLSVPTSDSASFVPEQAPAPSSLPSTSAPKTEVETTAVAEQQPHSDLEAEPFVDVHEGSPVVSEASLGEFDDAGLVQESTKQPLKDAHASDDEFEML